MSVQPYPTYKDSGSQWIGLIPNRWTATPLRHLVDCLDGKRIPLNREERSDKQGEVPYWGANSIMDFVEEALLDGELVLLGEDGAPFFDRTKPVAFFSQGPIWPNNHIHVLRARGGCHSAFLAFALNAVDYANYINGSTRDKLTQDNMNTIVIPCPSIGEQSAIATFLDRETGKIDALVAEQERLMALLKEKRQAVISQAVTKGLNPNAPMKPSGVEWLGEVPKEWEMRKLRNLAQLESGHTPSRQRPEYWIEDDCIIPWFTLVDVGFLRNERNIYIETTSQKISPFGMEHSSARLLPAETVILSRTASVGFSGIAKHPLAVSQDFACWICGSRILPRYLLFCLRAMKSEFHRLMMGSTHQTIYMPDIEAFRVPVPSVEEQSAIVGFIDTETMKLDTLVAEILRALSLFKERRAALISAAVTGKIDVRGMTATVEEAA